MPEPTPSLVQPQAQAEFFAEETQGMELLLPETEQRGRFTAERVAHNQERYRTIVRALSENLPVRYICRAFSISHHTVKAIREREPELIATEKQRVAKLLGHVARMSIERYAEALDNGLIPPSTLPVASAVMLDKKAMLEGEATVLIGHVRQPELTIEAVLARMKRAEATVQNLDNSRPPDSHSEGLALLDVAAQALAETVATFGATGAPRTAETPGPGGGGLRSGVGVEDSMGSPKRAEIQKDL